MISWNRLSAPGLATDNNIGAVLGGGIDMKITKLFTWRVAEADYVYARHNYSDLVSSSFPGLRRPSLEGLRFRSGILWTLDYPQTAVPAAACSLQPTEVMQGEPITATATGSNFNPKHSLMYDWSGTGGKVTGKDNGASIDTNGVAAGTYMVTAHVKDPKMKKGGEASCTASYTVKPNNPPQVSCSASPSGVQVGGSATVNCTCSSPDNVPVRVSSWNATSGTISGSGSSATLSTTGASAGTSSISATCTDSRGLTAQASTQVTIENPPPPPSPLEAKLTIGRSVYFPTAKPSPQDPNGGLEPSQQKTLTDFATDFKTYLQAKPDAQITLQGHADKRGTAAYNQALSQRRVDRAKNFLVEQGVPASAIQTQALGDEHNLTPEEVKEQVDNTTTLTQEERDRIMKRMQIIIWASNRRVDISLNGTNQTSVRHLPFHADDALTIIGGHTSEMQAKKPMPKKKMAPKQ
jgi:outer membrane protein OmpA-like peptidoglycan-associated protein